MLISTRQAPTDGRRSTWLPPEAISRKARLLIEAGAEVDWRKNIDGEETPLMEAGWLGRAELVRLLLKPALIRPYRIPSARRRSRSLENP